MRLLPIENISFKTDLSPEQVLHRIKENIEPKKEFRFITNVSAGKGNPYEGSVTRNSFVISRVITYKNSFLPRIEGQVLEDDGGASIYVKMRLHHYVRVFMTLWFGGILAFTCYVLVLLTPSSEEFLPTLSIAFGMLVFGYVLSFVAFKYESRKSVQYLAKLLQSNPLSH